MLCHSILVKNAPSSCCFRRHKWGKAIHSWCASLSQGYESRFSRRRCSENFIYEWAFSFRRRFSCVQSDARKTAISAAADFSQGHVWRRLEESNYVVHCCKVLYIGPGVARPRLEPAFLFPLPRREREREPSKK